MSSSVITPPALARTYSPLNAEDGWEIVDQYLLVAEWNELHPDASWRTAAKILELPERRVERWFNGKKPHVVKQIEIADSLGWFDNNWGSDIGRAFNLLTAAALSGGSVGKDFSVRVMLDDGLDVTTEQSLTEAIRVLVGSTRIVNKDDSKRGTELQPGNHRSLLGRALHVLGVPRGRKTTSEMILPEHLDTASPKLREEFVVTYISLRGSQAADGDIDIREERNQSYLESLATLIEDVTGDVPVVRTNGIHVPKTAVEALPRSVVWDRES
jgi:hypothetical protein